MHSVGNIEPEPTTRPGFSVNDLQRIADLHRSGELTDDEYAELKSRMLYGS